jgi:hypothetical protein
VPYLKAGAYTGSTVRTDVSLQLSKVSTEVQVLATADQLQSDSTTTEGAVGEQVIESMPNATQNPLYYATLLEGVVGRAEMGDSSAFQSFGIGYEGRRSQSALNVNGASSFTASIQGQQSSSPYFLNKLVDRGVTQFSKTRFRVTLPLLEVELFGLLPWVFLTFHVNVPILTNAIPILDFR